MLKGPQTVLHGPGNSAGVVLFEREPERYSEPGIHAYASPTFGSFGRNDQVAEVKAGARKAYVQASGTRSALDDYEDGGGQSVHSRYERWSANAALGWTPDEATRVELSGARSDGEAAYADRTMDGVKFSRENIGLRLERRNVSRNVRDLEGQLYYNYVDHVMDNYTLRPFTASPMMPNPSVANPDRRTVGGRVSAAFELGAATKATIGGDLQDNRHAVRRSSNQTSDPYETHDRVRDAAFENVGAFGEVTQGVGSKGHVIAGARVDRWTGNDDRQTVAVGMGSAMANPTAGMRRRENLVSGFARFERQLGSEASLYAGGGHAERAPDYWELISKESTDSVSAFETRPEKTNQLDAGVLYRRGSVSGSVAMFANDISDFILIESNYAKTTTTMGGNTMGGGMSGGMSAGMSERKTTITRNVDASSWGGEATLAWEATKRLKIDTSVAFVSGPERHRRSPARAAAAAGGPPRAAVCDGPLVGRRPHPPGSGPGPLRAQPGKHRGSGPRPDGPLRRVLPERGLARGAPRESHGGHGQSVRHEVHRVHQQGRRRGSGLRHHDPCQRAGPHALDQAGPAVLSRICDNASWRHQGRPTTGPRSAWTG